MAGPTAELTKTRSTPARERSNESRSVRSPNTVFTPENGSLSAASGLRIRTRTCSPRAERRLTNSVRTLPGAPLTSIIAGCLLARISTRAAKRQSRGSKTSLPRTHSGHSQSSGKSSKGVPGGTPLSGSPSAGSYTYEHALHCHFCMSITFVRVVSANRRVFLFLFPQVAPHWWSGVKREAHRALGHLVGSGSKRPLRRDSRLASQHSQSRAAL
jgi:hypothetical protein